MFLLFRPVDMTYLMRENPNRRDIPETFVCLLIAPVEPERECTSAREATSVNRRSPLGWFPGSAKAEVHDCVIGELRAVVQLHDKWQSSPCIGGHFVEP